MTITYSWLVSDLKVKQETNQDDDVLTDAVCSVRWYKTGTDEDGNEGIFYGVTEFSAYEVALADFVSFENLTEELVLSWVQAKVTGNYEEHVDERIAEKIAAAQIENKRP